MDCSIYDQVVGRLNDFGGQRLDAMDRAGIERLVLSLSGPGVQIERDRTIACRKARAANDLLSRETQRRPDRYAGFAHLPMQDPIAAADELERCVSELGFCASRVRGVFDRVPAVAQCKPLPSTGPQNWRPRAYALSR